MKTDTTTNHPTNQITGIITHSGRAHEDETIALALALHLNPQAWVERNHAITPEQLENPEILILDTGKDYDPEKSNFDHHQMEINRNDPESNECAATLYFQHIFGENYPDILEIHPWLTALAIKDNIGTRALAQWAGTQSTRALQGMLCSPTSTFWTNTFSQLSTRLMPGEFMHQMLCMLGNDIYTYTSRLLKRLDALDNGAIRLITLCGATISVINIPFDEEPALGLSIWFSRQKRKKGNKFPKVLLTFYPSKIMGKISVHDPLNGQGRFNLLRLEHHPEVDFVHKGGFLAAFSHDNVDDAIRLIFEKADLNQPIDR